MTYRLAAAVAATLLAATGAFAQQPVTITNYGSTIINAVMSSSGAAAPTIAPVIPYILSGVGSNGAAVFNGAVGNTLTGTGINGSASANGTVSVSMSAGVPGIVNGTISSGQGDTVRVTWAPVIQSDGDVHLQMTVTVQTSSGSYSRDVNVVIQGLRTLLGVYGILPPDPRASNPNATVGNPNGTSSGGGGGGGPSAPPAGTTSAGVAPTDTQLQNFTGPGGGMYTPPDGVVTIGPITVVE